MMNIDFTTLTEDELKALYKGIVDEHARRDRMKRTKLIEDFKTAFYALQDAGIDVTYSECDDDIEELSLYWAGFNFD